MQLDQKRTLISLKSCRRDTDFSFLFFFTKILLKVLKVHFFKFCVICHLCKSSEASSKKSKGSQGTIQRSQETGMAVELQRNMSRQPSRESNNGSTNSYNSEGRYVSFSWFIRLYFVIFLMQHFHPWEQDWHCIGLALLQTSVTRSIKQHGKMCSCYLFIPIVSSCMYMSVPKQGSVGAISCSCIYNDPK